MLRYLCWASTVAVLTVPLAAAQDRYPTRPIRIVVPSSPGGGLDFVARAVGQQLTAAWGQSVVIDNRAGAGGTIGPDLVAKGDRGRWSSACRISGRCDPVAGCSARL